MVDLNSKQTSNEYVESTTERRNNRRYQLIFNSSVLSSPHSATLLKGTSHTEELNVQNMEYEDEDLKKVFEIGQSCSHEEWHEESDGGMYINVSAIAATITIKDLEENNISFDLMEDNEPAPCKLIFIKPLI